MTNSSESAPGQPLRQRPGLRVKLGIVVGTILLVFAGLGLYARQQAHANNVALDSTPKPVSVVEVQAGTYQAERHYVATIEPWIMANVGPQLIAAFVDTVLVRPGAAVKRGQVLATLDCRDANASYQAIAAQARAIDTKQKALASEAARISSMVDGGFAAPNEAEQKLASSESELAHLMATQAKLAGSSVAVNDCVLRAAFDGEISERFADPGSFVRPGTPIVSVIDRSTVRISAEVPEGDFRYVAPGTQARLKMLATQAETLGSIARLSPAANGSTRTVHFEVDLQDPNRTIPVGTTAEVTIRIGESEPAAIIPGIAASVRGQSATVFVTDGSHARRRIVPVKGESIGTLYVDPSLEPGTRVVTEGRSLLADGDAITATLIHPAAKAPAPATGAKQ